MLYPPPPGSGTNYLFPIGSNIRGFRVLKPIAQGGVSEIYSVEDTYGIPHILKIPLPRELIDKDEKGSVCYSLTKVLDADTRTKNELQMLKRFNHPNLIKLHGVVEGIPIPRSSQRVLGLLLEPLEDPMTLEEVMKDMPQDYENHRPWTQYGGLSFEKRTEYSVFSSKHPYIRYLPLVDWGLERQRGLMQSGKDTFDLEEEIWPIEDDIMISPILEDDCNGIMTELNRRYADFFFQAETGIEHMISKGIVHKDLKPSNILVDRFQQIKIIDLGMASDVDDKKSMWASRKTIPPEAHLGILHPTADLWALGLMVYEATYGHHLFSRTDDVHEIAAKIKQYSAAINTEKNELCLPLHHDETETSDRHLHLPAVIENCINLLSGFSHRDEIKHPLYGGKTKEQPPQPRCSKKECDAYRLASYLNINPQSRHLLKKRPPLTTSCASFVRKQVNGVECSSLTIE